MHWFLVSELQISFIGVPFQDAMLHLYIFHRSSEDKLLCPHESGYF